MSDSVKLTVETGQEAMPVSQNIINRLKENNVRFFSNDNISEYIKEGEKELLIDELTGKFEDVLKSLIIDIENDPNSQDTGRRLAKMYIKELFDGRYTEAPSATAFPNVGEEKYNGMLVVRADIKSVCSHHWAPVQGTAYIGIIPNSKVLGLSKYIRIAQWHARRGTLQEELCQRIQKSIATLTETDNVAVHIVAKHGCVELRGVEACNSNTQTTVLGGDFKRIDLKQEFFDNVKMQESSFRCY
jgi:GTP cyclohydrolase IA